VESPQQNGRVERKHQHILNVGRALLYQSNLPKSFWSYAVVHAVFIINKIPTPILQNRSPHELMHGALPDLQILKVFGSLVYASTLQNNRTKLDPRGRKCIFLGYKQGVKGTILFDLNTKDIFISRNVTHYEHILPYQSNSSKFTWHYHSLLHPLTTYVHLLINLITTLHLHHPLSLTLLLLANMILHHPLSLIPLQLA
jgi:hypothetical protein